MNPRATTRSVQPSQPDINRRFSEIAQQNPDIARLTDQAFAEAAMHPEVLGALHDADARRIDLHETKPLATDWMQELVRTGSDVPHEPTAEERHQGEAVTYDPEINQRNHLQIATTAAYIDALRARAVQRGNPDFSQDSFTLAA